RGGPRRACRSDSTPDAPPKKPRREPRIVDPRPPHVAPSQARATRASPAVESLRATFPQGPSAKGLPERLNVAAVGATRLPERLNAAAVGATCHPPPAARHALSTGPVGLHRHTPTPRFAGSGGQAGGTSSSSWTTPPPPPRPSAPSPTPPRRAAAPEPPPATDGPPDGSGTPTTSRMTSWPGAHRWRSRAPRSS